jgi:hypothetical protein
MSIECAVRSAKPVDWLGVWAVERRGAKDRAMLHAAAERRTMSSAAEGQSFGSSNCC